MGIMWAFSSAIRKKGGTKIVVTRKMRDMAVCITAFLATACDLPIGSRVSLLRTSMPFLISLILMKNALRNPAEATAQKLLSALRKISRLPVEFASWAESNFRMPRPTPIAEDVAIVYDKVRSAVVYYDEALRLA